jgi:RNA polymerase sigma-70 factor (ECF subfamily)
MGIDQLAPDVHVFTSRLIRRKARQLAAKENFSPSDRDDIAQDLWLHLLERLEKFDPEKGTIFAFIQTVVERKTVSILRRHTAAKRDICRCSSLNLSIRADDGTRMELASTIAENAPDPRLCQQTRHPQHRMEIAIDVESVVSQMPADLQELCERLKTHTLTEIAQETGIPRTTLYGRVRQIREFFEKSGFGENT